TTTAPRDYTLSLHDALPILVKNVARTDTRAACCMLWVDHDRVAPPQLDHQFLDPDGGARVESQARRSMPHDHAHHSAASQGCATDRKSTRLNSSHRTISYAV